MTHDTPPKRIWADPPETFDGMDVWRSEPGGKGIPYILASEAEAMVAAALREAAEGLLDWYTNVEDDRGPHMVVRALIPQPASAALDKLIAEAVKAERDSAIRGRNEWRDDYKALAKAIVGETGLSAMTVAAQARLYRPRAEAAEAQLAEAQKREAGLESALRNLVDRDCIYDGPRLIITADSHGDAIRLASEARAALSAAPPGEESNE